MDYELSQLSDIDIFFFYGEPGSDLLIETESDILAGIMQPKRSLYYDRQDSSGIPEKENFPNSFVLSVMTKYDITKWNSYRNTQVSDGSNGTSDRRVAISQNSIDIKQDKTGNMDVAIQFIPFANIKQVQNITIPM
jgi:hypothetical protein